jgi:RNA-directed DNA polymerase
MSLLDEMIEFFRIGPRDLMRIINTAPARYKQYTIPKRHGGVRVIAQPSRELKALQRYILEHKLSEFPIHPAATAYVKGKNILDNAAAHKRNRVILKLDFADFFPSIAVRDWDVLLRTHRPQAIEAIDLPYYRLLLFWGQGSSMPKCLSIGAPTSPAVSNIMMYELDRQLSVAADLANVGYTRYADDITASGSKVEEILEFERRVVRIIKACRSPSLTFNDGKRGIFLKGQKRMVTGLIITPQTTISIGRERKRLISVMLHKVVLGVTDSDHLNYLKGMLGFCIANEPQFLTRMRRKYGSGVVDFVLHFTPPE